MGRRGGYASHEVAKAFVSMEGQGRDANHVAASAFVSMGGSIARCAVAVVFANMGSGDYVAPSATKFHVALWVAR